MRSSRLEPEAGERNNYFVSQWYGGEGGIRTLGTGISQYNGLASLSFDAAPIGSNGLQADYLTAVGPNRSHTAIFVLSFVLRFSCTGMCVGCPFHARRRHISKVSCPARTHLFGAVALPRSARKKQQRKASCRPSNLFEYHSLVIHDFAPETLPIVTTPQRLYLVTKIRIGKEMTRGLHR
jgi:hypothetical protein